MKKIAAAITLFSMFLTISPFAVRAQDMARVTVTIKSLGAIETDAWDGNPAGHAWRCVRGDIDEILRGRRARRRLARRRALRMRRAHRAQADSEGDGRNIQARHV